jgi:mannose-6-phosphate isomerase-like protein (cupin superfamily)
VQPGDAVTIPLCNYHPVFSQEEPLEFIWCIAGNRYWVGDKNKDFMSGKVATLTT